MRIIFGTDYQAAKAGKPALPMILDSERLVNPHVLLLGISGAGKSVTLGHMIKQGHQTDKRVRFHVFDVHGDLEIPGASTVSFSEISPFGLNPLRVNPDPEFGGPRKCIQAFIRTVNQASSTALGVKQEAVLRNILEDVFSDFGFKLTDPATWSMNAIDGSALGGARSNRLYLDIPFGDIEQAKAFGARWEPSVKAWWVHTEKYDGELLRWEPLHRARQYPTVADVLQYAHRIHVERFLGSDQKAVQLLNDVNKKARALQRKFLEQARFKNQGRNTSAEDEELALAKTEAVGAYSDYVNAVRTGYELETLLKYESADVLKSVIDRLRSLDAMGVFKNEAPPFDSNAAVWRYKLNALMLEERKMMVLFLLQSLFNEATQRGVSDYVADVAILDELSTYTSQADNNGDGIIGVIARQARKYGLALWAADQTPDGVPKSLSSSVGTKIILRLDEGDWRSAVDKLRIDAALLSWVTPTRSMAVQFKERGSTQSPWNWVQISFGPTPSGAPPRRA